MLPSQHIVAAVHRHWDASTSLLTLYPGCRVDLAAADQWCELWVDAWSDAPSRHASPDRLNVSILLHCFSRHPSDKLALHKSAHAARSALSGVTLPILDDTLPIPQTLGWLTIHEANAHDLTRNHAAAERPHLQHLVLALQATAQELPPA